MSRLDELDRLCRRKGWRLGLEVDVAGERGRVSRLVVKRKGGGIVAAGLVGPESIEQRALALIVELGKDGES